MEHRTPTPEDRELSRLLQRWQVAPEVPPRFADGVWDRIAAREAAATAGPAGFWSMVSAWVMRPRFVAAYLAAVLVLGAGTGAMRGHLASASAQGDLKGLYVQSIDPFSAAHR